MFKVFNIKEEAIEKMRAIEQNYCIIKSDILDLPYGEMYQRVRHICEKMTVNNGQLFVHIDVTGEADREDIEDIYNVCEDVLTNCFCSEEINEEKAERLGLFGLPDINMKAVNLLRWIKHKSEVEKLSLVVMKQNSFWKKRLVK